MCGIAGFILNRRSRGGHLPVKKLATQMLLEIEERGKDATGVLGISNGSKGKPRVYFERLDAPATEFVQTRFIADGTSCALLHARKATQGHQQDLVNNHPVVFNSCYVVHNGHINNDKEIIEEAKAERSGEVDSFAIPVTLDYHGWTDTADIKTALHTLEGGFAIAATDPFTRPDVVLLAKGDYSPLIVLTTPHGVFWASTKKAIHEAWAKSIGSPPTSETKQPGDYGYYEFKEGEFWVVDMSGAKPKLTAGTFEVAKSHTSRSMVARFSQPTTAPVRNGLPWEYQARDAAWTCWPSQKGCIFGEDCGNCHNNKCDCFEGNINHPRMNSGTNFKASIDAWPGFRSLVQRAKLTEDMISCVPPTQWSPMTTITPTHVKGGLPKTSSTSETEPTKPVIVIETQCFFCHNDRPIDSMITIMNGDKQIYKCNVCVESTGGDVTPPPGHDPELQPFIDRETGQAKVANGLVEAALVMTAREFNIEAPLVRYLCLYTPKKSKIDATPAHFIQSVKQGFKDNLALMNEARQLEAAK